MTQKLIHTLFFGLLLFSSCNKDPKNDIIPYVPVNINIYVSDPAFFELSVIGGFTYINGGSKGIVVYRQTQDVFLAFDRHCTYNVNDACSVQADSSLVFLEDSCCGSSFMLFDGSVSKGPATIPLKQYATSFDGNVLLISN